MPAPRILVVEDEPMIAIDLWDQLTRLGYDVPDPVANGDHALRAIEDSRPDLVLMDINIQGHLDGIATAAMIPPVWRIPVIYLTATSEDATVARAGATNPYGYLVKPFAARELHAMVQVTLARCQAERASHAALQERWQSRKMLALGQLAGGVADNINGLLSVIQERLAPANGDATDHQAGAEPARKVVSETIENDTLVHRLLALSGRQKLNPDKVSAATCVDKVFDRFYAAAGHSVRTRTYLPDDLWTIQIDAARFEDALFHLAMNAREAMPRGGDLTIDGQNATVARDHAGLSPDVTPGPYVLMTIGDTGVGMPEHVIERAFEPFFTTKQDGDGLGLSLVFGFIRQSGGHISIDSEPGRGSTVRLWLPAAVSSATTARPVTLNEPTSTGAGVMDEVIAGAITGRPPANGTPFLLAATQPERDKVRHAPRPAVADDTGTTIAWHKSENALFAALRSGRRGLEHRLIVEQLPRRNAWDWTVWRPGDASEPPRHGSASSAVIAMAAAEDAVRQRVETVAEAAATNGRNVLT
jgi:signal transduction histidine kinase